MVTSQTYDRFQGSHRMLLVFAPSPRDDEYDGQMLCTNDFKEGFEERDLVVLEVLAEGESRAGGTPLTPVETDSLRKRFGAPADGFLAVLVGKDGTEKARWTSPVSPVELFRLVDSMPMRQEEMRRDG